MKFEIDSDGVIWLIEPLSCRCGCTDDGVVVNYFKRTMVPTTAVERAR